MLITEFKDDISGNLRQVSDEHPLILKRYRKPYRAVVTADFLERANAALDREEAQQQEQVQQVS